MKITIRNRRRRADAGAQSARETGQPGEGLESLDGLLDQSRAFSENARTGLQDVEAAISAIGSNAPENDNLDEVGKLVQKSKGFSGKAKASLKGVGENADAIGREAEARQQLNR
jgi:hypothetical protein